MHWKLKALLLEAVSRLPGSAGNEVYYRLQKGFGHWYRGLKPLETLESGRKSWEMLCRQGIDPRGARFLEVGTGRTPLVPLAWWLLGAGPILTLDVNVYLKEPVLRDCMGFLAQDPDRLRELLGQGLDENRMDRLLSFARQRTVDAKRILAACGITYRAPADASRSGLPSGSIDFHCSNNVLEHIPPVDLCRILQEGARLVGPQGWLVHRVDYSDHFAHSDPRISALNLLKYDDRYWHRLAGNRFMYVNRLRHDDMLEMFESSGLETLAVETRSSERVLALLQEGKLVPAERFRRKSQEVLAITGSWLLARPTTRG